MIEVPEELIERALQGWPRIVDTPKGMGRHECLVRHVLAAVLPDLIAAIEGEYEQVGWTTPYRNPPHLYQRAEAWSTGDVPVFVRRVP